MLDDFVFGPDRRTGLIFHISAIMVFLAVGLLCLWMASQAISGSTVLLYLLPLILNLVAVPFLTYRIYTIRTSSYIMNREAIQLRWGFRYEKFPISDVIWIHSAIDFASPIDLPRVHWPGSLVGTHRLPDGRNLEFIATDEKKLVLIATTERIFAISPAEPEAFLKAFQRLTELGSLTQPVSQSEYPTRLLSQAWFNLPARFLIIIGLVLNISLIIWISVLIQSRSQVPLGFRANGVPGDFVPSAQLFLLPVINCSFTIADILLGLFFFRSPDTQPLSYLLWAGGIFTSILFLTSVFLIGNA